MQLLLYGLLGHVLGHQNYKTALIQHVSSSNSLAAAKGKASFTSTNPPGIAHLLAKGGYLRFISKIFMSCLCKAKIIVSTVTEGFG